MEIWAQSRLGKIRHKKPKIINLKKKKKNQTEALTELISTVKTDFQEELVWFGLHK